MPDTSRVLKLRHRLEQSARDTWFEELVKLVSAKACLFKPFGGIRPPNQIAGLTKGPTQLTQRSQREASPMTKLFNWPQRNGM